MSLDSKVVYWIGAAAEKKPTEELRSGLRRLGLRSEWVSLDSTVDVTQPKWFETNFPGVITAVVWVGGTAERLKQLMKALRGENNSRTPYIPVFVGTPADKRERLADLAACTVDGAFFYSEDPDSFAHDVLLRCRGTQERDDLRQQLRDLQFRSARNETVVKQREEFLGVAAHDLRSPLGLIQASLGMVIDQAGREKLLNPVQLELLTRAKRQSIHALGLVNDLLDVMCFEQGLKPDYKILNLHELLTEFYGDYRLQAEQKQVNFHYQNAIQDWKVLADSDRVRQLLQNLFGNALKFTDAGKNIFLTVEPFHGRRKSDPPYPMVVISVKDEGKGIPPRELQKIFDRFAQLRDQSRSEGRGLGLTVAKQISTLHDGNIWVQSVEGKGSVFHVLLPHVISRVNADSEKAGEKLLIIEPSAEKREALQKTFEDWDLAATFVKDGVSAIAMAFHEPPAAVLFGGDLGLIREDEVVTMLRAESATASVPLIRWIPIGIAYQKRDDVLIDAFVDQPLSRQQIETVLIQLGRADLVKGKKAA